MNFSSKALLVSLISTSMLITACTKTAVTTPTCDQTKAVNPFDTINLQFEDAHSLQILSSGQFAPLQNTNVTATAYVVGENSTLYTIPATAVKTDSNGQAKFSFNLTARLTKSNVTALVVQFSAAPGKSYQQTVIYDWTNGFNFLNFEVIASHPQVFDSVACAWPSPDSYDIGYKTDIQLQEVPSAQRSSLGSTNPVFQILADRYNVSLQTFLASRANSANQEKAAQALIDKAAAQVANKKH